MSTNIQLRATLTMPKELAEEIKTLAATSDRSFSRQIVFLIKRGMRALDAIGDKDVDPGDDDFEI